MRSSGAKGAARPSSTRPSSGNEAQFWRAFWARCNGSSKRCIAQAKHRKQFGQPIGKFQSVSNRIVDMKLRLETSRFMVYRYAWATVARRQMQRSGRRWPSCTFRSALPRTASTHCEFSAPPGFQAGGSVERDLRDSAGGVIFSGTNDIQRNLIAHALAAHLNHQSPVPASSRATSSPGSRHHECPARTNPAESWTRLWRRLQGTGVGARRAESWPCWLVIYVLDRDGAFYQSYSLKTLLHRVALFGVLAVGAAVVIIAGGIDLSTGAVVSLSSVVSAKLLTEWLRDGIVGAALDRAHRAGDWPDAAHGNDDRALPCAHDQPAAASALHRDAGDDGRPAQPGDGAVPEQDDHGAHSLPTGCWGKSHPGSRCRSSRAWPCFMSILMGCTVLGRHLFALGGNETAARLSGLRTHRLKMFAYAIAGTLSALGGVLFTGFSGQGDSRMGTAYELTAITAAVVGGCSLVGRSRLDPGHGARPAR